MKDIVAVGEVLIDLTQKGTDELGVGQYAANPGGAPANLAVAAARLGASTAFVGKVGADAFGAYLRRVLEENRVDTRGMLTDPREHTTLAVVSVDGTGERSFSFYRDPSADVNLRAEEIPADLLRDTRVVHFGSVSLTAEPARSATLYAAKTARENGCLVSYDPNYRASLWHSREEAVAQMKAALPLCDILKISDEELPLLTGTTDPAEGSQQLSALGIRLMGILHIALGGDAHHFQHLHGLVHGFLLAAMLMQGHHLGDLVAHGHQRVQSGHGVLEDHGDLLAADAAHLLFRQLQQILSIQDDLAVQDLRGRVGQDAQDGFGDGGLARAGLAHQAQAPAPLDFQGNAVHRVDHRAGGGVNHLQVPHREEDIVFFFVLFRHAVASCQSFSLGSRASRRPSPTMFSDRTASMMVMPGKITMWG